METRKLQEVGGGTFTVSIPKRWAETRRLEAGAEVHLYPHGDGSILLSAAATDGDDLASATVEVAGDSPARISRALRAAVAAGFETITLVPETAFTDEQQRAARAAARSLVGTVIDTETADEVTVRHVLDVADVSIRQSVLQLQYAALSIHEAGTAAFVTADGDAAERLGRRAAEVDRQRSLISRHCNRALVSFAEVDRLDHSRSALFDAHETAGRLERIAECGVGLARAGGRLGAPLRDGAVDDVEDVATAARELVDDAVTAVLDGARPSPALDVLERTEQLSTELRRLEDAVLDGDLVPGSSARSQTFSLTRVLCQLDRTVTCCAEIATVALRRAVRDANVDDCP